MTGHVNGGEFTFHSYEMTKYWKCDFFEYIAVVSEKELSLWSFSVSH